MRVPKRFKLLGHTIEVSEEPARYFERNAYGACSYEGKWIKLVPKGESHPVTQSSVEHTFLHELTHILLYHTEQSQLTDNEKFVDVLSGLLHQALTTMEYE
jgi:predicted SprT family Zn-dependent metalloprotease